MKPIKFAKKSVKCHVVPGMCKNCIVSAGVSFHCVFASGWLADEPCMEADQEKCPRGSG